MSNVVICLMGPTASGKTALALELVKALPCDIISVDSAMVYRGMDIGTAKPSPEVLKQAPHRLIDIRDPNQPYSAADFCEDAEREIKNTLANKRIPLLVGGTMLYFQALQQGLAELPQASLEIRQQLSQQGEQLGWPAMHARLQQIDPTAAARINANDPQRIQRALEVYAVTGKSMTELFAQQTKKTKPYRFINIALIPSDRSVLHDRIAKRFSDMLDQGFLQEVKNLYQRGDLSPDLPAIRAVGYRQAWEHLAGNLSLKDMQDKAIIATRQLAKRQLTWLRSWENLTVFDCLKPNILDHVILRLDRRIQES